MSSNRITTRGVDLTAMVDHVLDRAGHIAAEAGSTGPVVRQPIDHGPVSIISVAVPANRIGYTILRRDRVEVVDACLGSCDDAPISLTHGVGRRCPGSDVVCSWHRGDDAVFSVEIGIQEVCHCKVQTLETGQARSWGDGEGHVLHCCSRHFANGHAEDGC